MNPIHHQLRDILKAVPDCVVGPWFVGDGALLGLVREGRMIEYDDDIDIYLLPGSYIDTDKLKNKYNLEYQKYYICDKIYNPKNKKKKLNKWNEYVAYNRHLPENYGLNKPQLFSESKKNYKDECIIPNFTYPCIDVFYLEDEDKYNYLLPYYFGNIHFTDYLRFRKQDVQGHLKTKKLLGVDIPIPHNEKEILTMLYGEDWRTPKKSTFIHFKDKL